MLDADTLPPLKSYAPFGALILLDERVETGAGCGYTQIALIGDAQAAERFANIEVYQHGVPAVIKGRVRYPDGTVRELRDEDLACGERRDYGLIRLGPALGPARMFVHFPRLTPGSLVQIQVFTGCLQGGGDFWQAFFPALRGRHRLFNLWQGSGDAFTLSSGFETRHYPAQTLRHALLGLKSVPLQWKTDPGEVPLAIREFPGRESHQRITQFSTARPFLPDEPYEPPFSLRSPLFMATYPDRSFKETGWDALVNVMAAYGDDATSAGAARVLEVAPLQGATDTLSVVRHFNRFFRDRPEGRREGYGREFGTFLGDLKSRGIPVKRVWVRSARQRPIDRFAASLDWFDDFLYAVDIAGERHYFSPHSKVPAGSLPIRAQGGEALVVTDRKHWEWVRLPVAEAPANRRSGELALTARDGGTASGTFSLTLTGGEAEGLRWLATAAPAEINSAALRVLGSNALEGLEFSNPWVDGLTDPDAPIVIRADAALHGAVIRLGARSRLEPVRWRTGPKAMEFLAAERSSEIDFGWPRLGTLKVSFPAAWLDEPLTPLNSREQGPGIDYALTTRQEGAAVVLERSLSWGGLHPAAEARVIRETLQRIDKADDYGFKLRSDNP